MSVVNLYKSMPNAKRQSYKMQKTLNIELPFRAIIIGKSGSMKTNLLFNIVSQINAWNKIYIFAKNLQQPLYETLIPKIEKLGGEVIASSDLADTIMDRSKCS
jgi:hypothetical protein